MKELKPHPHVIRLIGCVTESGNIKTLHSAAHLRILYVFSQSSDLKKRKFDLTNYEITLNESFPVEKQKSSDTKKCEDARNIQRRSHTFCDVGSCSPQSLSQRAVSQ